MTSASRARRLRPDPVGPRRQVTVSVASSLPSVSRGRRPGRPGRAGRRATRRPRRRRRPPRASPASPVTRRPDAGRPRRRRPRPGRPGHRRRGDGRRARWSATWPPSFARAVPQHLTLAVELPEPATADLAGRVRPGGGRGRPARPLAVLRRAGRRRADPRRRWRSSLPEAVADEARAGRAPRAGHRPGRRHRPRPGQLPGHARSPPPGWPTWPSELGPTPGSRSRSSTRSS